MSSPLSDVSDEELLSFIKQPVGKEAGLADVSDQELLSMIGESSEEPGAQQEQLDGTETEPKTSLLRGLGSGGLEFLTRGVETGAQAFGGSFQPEGPRSQEEFDQMTEMLRAAGGSEEDIGELFPGFTPQVGLREGADILTGGKLKPQTATERAITEAGGGAGEFVAATALLPGGGTAKALGKAASQGLRFGAGIGIAKEMGVGEIGQFVSGAAAATAPGILKGGVRAALRVLRGEKSPLRKHVGELFSKSRALGEELTVPSSQLESDMQAMTRALERELPTRENTPVLNTAKSILQKISGSAQIAANDVTSWIRNVNAVRGDPETLKGAKTLLNTISKSLNTTVANAAELSTKHAAWSSSALDANRAFAGIQANRLIRNLVDSKAIRKLSPFAALAFGLPSLPTVAKGAAILGAGKAIQVTNRIATNPVLRKFYVDIMKAAAKGNKATLIKAVRAFDQEVRRSDVSLPTQGSATKIQ